MDTTFSLIQTSSTDKLRLKAAALLRRAAASTHNVDLSMLATSVELDAFTKVKSMIDKMIETLKTKDLKADLEAKSGQLENSIKTLAEEIEKANLDIANLQVELQRASE